MSPESRAFASDRGEDPGIRPSTEVVKDCERPKVSTNEFVRTKGLVIEVVRAPAGEAFVE
jgi:hypothetical protein